MRIRCGPRQQFVDDVPGGGVRGTNFDVASDGRLVVSDANIGGHDLADQLRQFNVVVNWFEELRRLAEESRQARVASSRARPPVPLPPCRVC